MLPRKLLLLHPSRPALRSRSKGGFLLQPSSRRYARSIPLSFTPSFPHFSQSINFLSFCLAAETVQSSLACCLRGLLLLLRTLRLYPPLTLLCVSSRRVPLLCSGQTRNWLCRRVINAKRRQQAHTLF